MKKNLVYPKAAFLKTVLFLGTLFLTFSAYANDNCGKIKKILFVKGPDRIEIVDNTAYQLSELPTDFRIATRVNPHGQTGEVKFKVTNLDTNEIQNYTDNEFPFRFPADGQAWNLGIGKFKIKAKLFKNSQLCDEYLVKFTIRDTAIQCGGIDKLLFVKDSDRIEILNNETYELSDLPNDFRINANVNPLGQIGKVKFKVTNLDTNEIQSYTDEEFPFRFPGNAQAWDLGTGKFRIKAKLFSSDSQLCDEYVVKFKIKDRLNQCGEIKKLLFARAGDSIDIVNGSSYELSDLPDNFRIKAKIRGESGKVVFKVTNLDTNERQDYTDNEKPYRFPQNGENWNLGIGNIKVDVSLYSINNTLCEEYSVVFTLLDTKECGSITGLVFTNGTETIAIENNQTYEVNDLPDGFYLEMTVNGASESATYYVQKTGTGIVQTSTDNSLPYNFPSSDASWDLGLGNFKVDTALYANNDANHPKCDQYWVMFTIVDTPEPCGTITDLVFTNGTDSITIENGETYEVSDLPNGFYLEMIVDGASESATYYVQNTGTDAVRTNVENFLPYNFPSGGARWNLGTGNFKVDTALYENNHANGQKCDQYWVMFTLINTPKPCGDISGLVFTNGMETIVIENGQTYEVSDLPDDFYLEMVVDGASESATYYVQNTGTGMVETSTDNTEPYNFPTSATPWALGLGSFKVDTALFANNNACYPKCDQYWVMFTLVDTPVPCGDITGLVFTNGTESVTIVDGQTYELRDLPEGFYIEMVVDGASESAKYYVTNVDTSVVLTAIDNEEPYNYPEVGPWELGLGNFKIDTILYANNDAHHPKCDQYWVMFTIVDTPPVDCGPITALRFTNGREFFPIVNGTTYSISDLPPDFYIDAIVDGLSESLEFTVTNNDTGLSEVVLQNETPYLFPGDRAPWALGDGSFTITAKLFLEDGAIGASCNEFAVSLIIEEEECNVSPGTLEASNTFVCVPEDIKKKRIVFDPIEISANHIVDPTVPAGYFVVYFLTTADEMGNLVISDFTNPTTAASTEPIIFEVTDNGVYNIHTFVYDPAAYDIATLAEGASVSDIATILVDENICGAIDVIGAQIEIISPSSGSLNPVDTPVNLENGTATVAAVPVGDINIPDGFQSIYLLSKGIVAQVIEQIGPDPSFVVTEVGDFSIHTLVYDVGLDIATINLGVTTINDVATTIIDSEGEICASLDVVGTLIVVQDPFRKTLDESLTLKKSSNKITIHPNPSSSVINVGTKLEINETLSYSIMDLSGRLVLKGQINAIDKQQNVINVTSIKKGLYLITFYSDYRRITKKIRINE